MTAVESVLPFLAEEPGAMLLAMKPLVAHLGGRAGAGRGGAAVARYSSPEFEAASNFVQAASAAGTPAAAAGHALRDPRTAVATARLLTRLPTVEVQLSSRPDGRAIRSLLRRQRLGVPYGRLARAVLRVPPSEEDYLRGRSRQALRTNAGHARDRGITCRSVDDVGERIAAARAVVGSRSFDEGLTRAWLHGILDSGEFFLAEATDGSPLVFASLCVDVRCSYLRAFMASQEHDDATLARYLLQLDVVAQLAKAGVTHLLGDCALRVRPGLRHFQHLLGFTAANVKVRPFVA